MKLKTSIILEWSGVITAILYSMLVALDLGAEFIGFSLLLLSAILLSLWSLQGNHRGYSFIKFILCSCCSYWYHKMVWININIY